MKMTFRWFGDNFDTITPEQIRQIPAVKGVITTLYDTMPGEVWDVAAIQKIKSRVESAGLEISGIESVNIHDAIKAATPDRDMYIENYIKCLERLGEEKIELVCYNFMPVFDWTRSDLAKPRPDGSNVLSYDAAIVENMNFEDMLESLGSKSEGFILPGWEPERMARNKELFETYADIDEAKLRENLGYFLKAIMPTCEKYNIKMAIHPDDPAWSVFGLPRIVKNKEDLHALCDLVDSPCNGVTLCTGSLGSNPDNDLPEIIRSLKGKIHFAHIRNVKYLGDRKFDEAAHLSEDGSLDMYEIIKAFVDIGFNGAVRPDHGRMVWGEKSMPGYGLYDRAMGICYLNGLLEAIRKGGKK
ncbi:MAG: mannonate dehydratase [Oscillospiraceae bacterium]|nr:mannonate dehydratase [Oscillospiraceae bacterium]